MSVVVVATAQPKAEHRDEVIALFESVIAQVQANDEGCELYALHEGPDRLVMIEKWASPEALATHAKGPLLAELRSGLTDKLAGKFDIQVLTPHPIGTTEQGTL